MAKMFIGGESVDSLTKHVYEVRNPANGELVDTVPKGNAEDVRRAVDAADTAFKSWSETTAEARAKWLFKAVDLIHENIQELSVLLCHEQGKPVKEAVTEIDHFLHGLSFYAGLAAKLRGSYVPLPDNKMYGMVIKQPLGVCAAIVPWNFPITLMGTKVGPALATGNTVVVKPASSTPLTTIRIIELMAKAGMPNGVINVVTGPGGVVGEALIAHAKVRRVAFTGESKTGKHVMAVAGQDFKRITLELGGSDPMIVCDDAEIDKALTGAAVGRYFNCGQACLAVKRLFVFESVYDMFVSKLVDKVKKLKVGNGMSADTRIGPLHNEAQRAEIEEQVQDAVSRGARVIFGGKRPEGPGFEKGFFYLPTLLVDVPDNARVATEEVFGPALPIFKVKDLDEAIAKANSSIYGLGSSIWTKDLTRARRGAERLQAGNVWINSLHIGYDEMPFGGVKQSGIGREHGPEALEYYLETKGIVVAT
ncbi:MAG: aldehyde dehydrogenase [Acidobacteria bacterium]|nr:aldehyde dehydrogenase [Acidobacteriota bacterium]MBI3658590.1 aldehyde dehydrogenase [Acidobacteriota bacterium]